MSWRKAGLLTGGLIVVFGLALAGTLIYRGHSVCGRQGAPDVLGAHSWVRAFDLTADQKRRLEPMEKSLHQDLQAIQVRLAEERMALCGLLGSEGEDSEALNEYTTRISRLEAEQQRRVVRHLLAMRDFLTPAQRDTFFAAIMHEVCEGCRRAVQGQRCRCGMCPMSKAGAAADRGAASAPGGD